jgi:hypothetical protein
MIENFEMSLDFFCFMSITVSKKNRHYHIKNLVTKLLSDDTLIEIIMTRHSWFCKLNDLMGKNIKYCCQRDLLIFSDES